MKYTISGDFHRDTGVWPWKDQDYQPRGAEAIGSNPLRTL